MPLFPVPESQLPKEGLGVRVPCGARDVALFRLNGELRAIEDVCPHAGAPLHDGWTEGNSVMCPLHGWMFDTRTGACETSPGWDVATFAVKIEDGSVSVEVPE